ncbi:hypothetical protein T02_13192 [Trichinella nativa]|uniref:Uncharacterized protein n=1 Tax=Trichinella nativa TaxID=6335 RepID=A0A0V1KU81_9BILA|nr:hypothetical protein T02_13192 [Trichinella nativa]
MSPRVISCSFGRMAGCFSVNGRLDFSSLPLTRSVPASSRKGLKGAALSLGDPHPGLFGGIQLLDSQGSASALSGGGSAVPHKAEAKCGDPEQPLDVAISSRVENVILGVQGPCSRGQPSAGPASHLGPCHQRLLLANPFKDDPRLSKSAGLFFPGQCFQHAGSTSRWISLTRLRTNGFHRLAADRTHGSVTSLSLQQNRERTSSCNALWAKRISLAAVRAPISSNFGRLRRFTGETRVFAATKLTRVAPDATTAPYARSDASQKAWSSICFAWSKERLEEDLRQHKEWGQAPYRVEDACSGAQHLPLRVPGRQTRSFRRYERQVVVTLPIDCQCLPGAASHPHRGLLYREFSESVWLVTGPFVEPESARSQQGPQLVRQASSFRNRVARGG